MKISEKLTVLSFVTMTLLTGCAPGDGHSLRAYRQWMDDEDNGLLVTKETGDIRLQVQWLPPELLVYQDYQNDPMLCNKPQRDSLATRYRQSMSFLLTITSLDDDDLLWKNVATTEEARARLHLLNFRMNEFVRLEAGGQAYRPVLHMLESDYGTARARKIHLVFADDDAGGAMLRSAQYDVVFEDELFMTGISHFVFERRRMEEVPRIDFWTCNKQKI